MASEPNTHNHACRRRYIYTEGLKGRWKTEGKVFETVPRWAQCGQSCSLSLKGKKDLKKDLEDIPRAIKQRRNGMPSRNSIRFVCGSWIQWDLREWFVYSRCEDILREEETLLASHTHTHTKIWKRTSLIVRVGPFMFTFLRGPNHHFNIIPNFFFKHCQILINTTLFLPIKYSSNNIS